MKYVIIGGNAAGMSAAMQILKFDKRASITVLEKGKYFSYGQCGMPYVVSRDVGSIHDLIVKKVETFREKFGIHALIEHEVEELDVSKQVVHANHLVSGEIKQFPYDKLLIASGAKAHIPKLEGVDLENVCTLNHLDDATEIMRKLTPKIKDVTIIGGGMIGLEMAESFIKRNLHVRIIQRSNHLGKMFDGDMAQYIHKEAERCGVHLVLNEDVEKLIGKKKVTAVKTNRAEYKTDLVLIATGVRPETPFWKMLK